MEPKSRVFLLAVLSCLGSMLTLVTPPPAVAATLDDGVTLEQPVRGQRAVDALGNDLATAAAANGLTTRAMRDLLLDDRTAWVDTTGRVFFKEPIPSGTNDAAEPEPAAPAQAAADAFTLHSKPGSQRVIFLDFDGSTVSGTAWNATYAVAAVHPAWTLDGDATTFSTTERNAIASIWARVAEDYAPFDVDVTTQDPGAAAIDRTSTSDQAYGTRVLVSPSADASSKICNNNCGGVAYIDVFDAEGASHAYYQPAWVFPQSLGNSTKSIAEAATHEAGHNFGLDHDGTATADYYSGHAMWAPIMGTGYSRPVVQWSLGEYLAADNPENDLAIIAASGAPLRADEAGGTVAAAAAALPTGNAYVTTRTDLDVYALGTCAGTINLVANPATTSPNLDIQLALLDASGTVVASNDPASSAASSDVATGMAASLAPSVATASYFLRVDGVGNGTGITGYTDYASIGAYTLTVTGNCGSTTPPDPVTSPSAPQGLTVVVRAGDLEADVDWAPPADDGGGSVTGYELSVDGAVVADLPASQTAATLSGLDDGETYVVEVRARNSAGEGAAAQTSFSVPEGEPVRPGASTPTAPRIGSAASGARGGRSTATVKWSPPATDGGSTINGYQVLAQRLNSSGTVARTVATRWLVPGTRSLKLRLAKGRYRFVVIARNAVGVSPWSARSRVVRAR